jgi:hypothetical protein
MLLLFGQTEGHPFLEAFQIQIPVQKNHFQMAAAVFIAEKPDSLETEKLGVMNRPRDCIDPVIGVKKIKAFSIE